jgi:hypothetical protein
MLLLLVLGRVRTEGHEGLLCVGDVGVVGHGGCGDLNAVERLFC